MDIAQPVMSFFFIMSPAIVISFMAASCFALSGIALMAVFILSISAWVQFIFDGVGACAVVCATAGPIDRSA